MAAPRLEMVEIAPDAAPDRSAGTVFSAQALGIPPRMAMPTLEITADRKKTQSGVSAEDKTSIPTLTNHVADPNTANARVVKRRLIRFSPSESGNPDRKYTVSQLPETVDGR